MLLYDELPTAVSVNGKGFYIVTDFREWIRFIDLAEATDITARDKVRFALEWYEDYVPADTEKAISALTTFLQGKYPEEDTGTETDRKSENPVPVFSYSYDAEAIFSDFMRFYNIDLLEVEYLHWWKFKALLNNLPDDSKFVWLVRHRSINLAEIEDKKERDRIADIKKRIALPTTIMRDEDIGNAFW